MEPAPACSVWPILSGSIRGSVVTEFALLQFEVIRTIAGSLISVAIVLLWLVAITGQR